MCCDIADYKQLKYDEIDNKMKVSWSKNRTGSSQDARFSSSDSRRFENRTGSSQDARFSSEC